MMTNVLISLTRAFQTCSGIARPQFFMSKIVPKQVAVLLSGCGVNDGTEITEAVSIMIALDRNNIKYQCYCPNVANVETVNHITGQIYGKDVTRNALEESARIARGNVKDIITMNVQSYEALFIPGGFGAAKCLSDFASKGQEFEVQKNVAAIIKQFYEQKKAIAACCIAPLIVSKVLGQYGIQVTLGKKDWPYSGTIDLAQKFGASVIDLDIMQVQIDKKNKIITTPAFMKDKPTYYEVFQGIQKMVDEAVKLI